jgi:cytochrome P450
MAGRYHTAATTSLEEAMANTAGYTRLPKTTREDVLAAARKQAERAAEHYAQLLAAEAGIAARVVFPNLARLVFRLTDDVFGSSATLIAAYTAQGRQLWHIDTGNEWPDESLVTDHLAAAADWCDDYFEAIDADDIDQPGGAELYVLDPDG